MRVLRWIGLVVQKIVPKRRKKRLRLDPPIVPPTGKPFALTNAHIYDLIGFP